MRARAPRRKDFNILNLPLTEDGQGYKPYASKERPYPTEKAQAGNNHSGNNYPCDNGKEGLFKLHTEEKGSDGTGPGSSAREGHGYKQHKPNPFIFLN